MTALRLRGRICRGRPRRCRSRLDDLIDEGGNVAHLHQLTLGTLRHRVAPVRGITSRTGSRRLVGKLAKNNHASPGSFPQAADPRPFRGRCFAFAFTGLTQLESPRIIVPVRRWLRHHGSVRQHYACPESSTATPDAPKPLYPSTTSLICTMGAMSV